ncbi:MAG: HAMP domain-containing sensor histidine kinase [Bacteroidota bacterium]
MLESFVDNGKKDTILPIEERQILLSKTLAIIISLAILLIGLSLYSEFGFVFTTIFVLSMAPVFLATLIPMAYGYHKIARLLIAILAPVTIMLASILTKQLDVSIITEYSFFNARTTLLGISIIPIVVFPYNDKACIFITLILSAIQIAFYDQIHALFGVGYTNLLGAPKAGYEISGVYYAVSFAFIVSILFFFKRSNHIHYEKRQALIQQLNETNASLSTVVDQKTKHLKESNDELIRHNSELQQFSNTVSHNVRGPVANILGLTNLLEIDSDEHSKNDLVKHIRDSANSLDATLTDLGKIIDIRNHLYQIKEHVVLADEFEKVSKVLEHRIEACDATIKTDFLDEPFYCVRSYMNSILYNLLSNALKYRDPQRRSIIEVKSFLRDKDAIITFKDNGIGINLDRYRDQVFGMYKRFHSHIDGKGLGLFLTKQQIESVGGKIDVESVVGEGTTFTITYPLPKLEAISEQVYFESDAATVWFDAVNEVSTLVWKREVSSEEYREALTRNLEIFKSYRCTGCLADVRKLGLVSEADRNWFVSSILADALDYGAKKFIVVHDSSDGKDDVYFESMRQPVEDLGLVFDHDKCSIKEAKIAIRDLEAKSDS